MGRAAAALLAWPRPLALALGLIAACGFEPLRLWPLSLGALAVLLELLFRAQTRRRAFLLGWLFGLGLFSLSLNWIATAFSFQAAMPVWLGMVAVVGLSLFLAIWPGLAALAAWQVARANRAGLVLAFAGCWTIGEWLRGWVFTGFPWNPLAALTLKSQANPGLAWLAQWTGTYALSGLVAVLAGGWMLAATRRRRDWQTAALALVPAVLFVVPTPVDKREGQIGYTLVQANVSQDWLHDSETYDDQFQRAARLSLAKQPGQRRVVFWSESGVPDLLRDGYPQRYYDAVTYAGNPALSRERLARIAGESGLLLTGNDELEMRGEEIAGARNAVTAIGPGGRIMGSYFKSHLVPYGEYVPLKGLLEPLGLTRFVPGDFEFWPGPGRRTLDLGPWGRAGVDICYEIIFSGETVDRANRPDYLYNPSNDGWYGDWGPPQHLAQTRLRAIEEGLPVIRATTTGISAVVDSSGAVRTAIPLRVAGRRDGLIPPALPPTPFARAGNALSLGWAIALLVLSLVARRRRAE